VSSHRIAALVACDLNNAIGFENRMPWRKLKQDMARFVRITKGHPVVMGRRTFESIGARPLPGRDNIVVTRSPARHAQLAAGHDRLRFDGSLEAALERARALDPAISYVIGGAEIYRLALPALDLIHMTRVNLACEADAYFPLLDPAEWSEQSRESVDDDGIALDFVDFRRAAG